MSGNEANLRPTSSLDRMNLEDSLRALICILEEGKTWRSLVQGSTMTH